MTAGPLPSATDARVPARVLLARLVVAAVAACATLGPWSCPYRRSCSGWRSATLRRPGSTPPEPTCSGATCCPG